MYNDKIVNVQNSKTIFFRNLNKLHKNLKNIMKNLTNFVKKLRKIV